MNPKFVSLPNVRAEDGTLELIGELQRLMTMEAEGRAVPKYEAIHVAILEAVERRRKTKGKARDG